MLKKEEALNGVKLFVLDMDGTVYLGDQLIDGALDFIHDVEQSEDRDFIFFTNNASGCRRFTWKSFISWDLMWMRARLSPPEMSVRNT